MTAGLGEYVKIAKEIEAEFPGFEIVAKENSTFMKVLDVVLKLITFWQMRTFMTKFVTQIGSNIYTPKGWDERHALSRAATFRHERIHLRQQKRYGSFMFTLRYLCWPLPAVLALGRRDIEMEAYVESIRARAEYFGDATLDDHDYREHLVGHFLSSNYFWTYPFRRKLETWYDAAVVIVRAERASN